MADEIKDPFEGMVDPFAEPAPAQEAPYVPRTRMEHLGEAVQPWKHVAKNFTEGVGAASRALNPWDPEYIKDRDAYFKETAESSWYDVRPQVKNTLRVGKGLLGVGQAALSPLLGAEESVRHLGDAALPPPTPEEAAELKKKGLPLPPSGGDALTNALSVISPVRGGPGWRTAGHPSPSAPTPPTPPSTGVSRPSDVIRSEGQRTGQLPLIQAEQAALQGTRGAPAQARALEFFEGQQQPQVGEAVESVLGSVRDPIAPVVVTPREAAEGIVDVLRRGHDVDATTRTRIGQTLDAAREYIRERLSPNQAVLARTPDEASGIVSQAVGAADEAAQAATNAAYARFRELPGEYHPATFNNVANEIRTRLARPEDPTQLTLINPETTPRTMRALDDLQEVLGGIAQRRDPETGRVLPRTPVTPPLVENARKRINVQYGDALNEARTTGKWEDFRAFERMRDAFDDAVLRKSQTTFTGGDAAEVMAALRDARRAHSQHRQTFYSRGSGDKVGPLMQKIIGQHEGQALTPEQLSATMYGGAAAVPLGRRLMQVFADAPEVIGALKQGLLSHIVEAPAGKTAYTPAQIASRVEDFTRGKGRSLTETYLTPQEIQQLRTYGEGNRRYGELVTRRPDRVQQDLLRMTGGDGTPRASIDDTMGAMFGSILRSSADAPEMVRRLVSGPNPQLAPAQVGQLREGTLRYAMQDVKKGEEAFGYKRIADNLHQLTTNEAGRALYTPQHRQMIGELEQLYRDLIVPKDGKNWSNTAPFLAKVVEKVGDKVVGLIATGIGHMVGMGLGASEAMGYGVSRVAARIGANKEARDVAKQLPLIRGQMEEYQKALRAFNKQQNSLTRKRLTGAAASLNASTKKIGVDLANIPALQLPGPVGAEGSEENSNVPGRAEGGAIHDPFEVSLEAQEQPIQQQPSLFDALRSGADAAGFPANVMVGAPLRAAEGIATHAKNAWGAFTEGVSKSGGAGVKSYQEAISNEYVPEGATHMNDAGEYLDKDGNVLTTQRRPNILPVTKTEPGQGWFGSSYEGAMPAMTDVWNTFGAPAKATVAMAAAKAGTEGKGASQAAQAYRGSGYRVVPSEAPVKDLGEGYGWWVNNDTKSVHPIDSGDLGPHGDHDGWVSLGENAEKLGLDPKKAGAFQAATWGPYQESTNPYVRKFAEKYEGQSFPMGTVEDEVTYARDFKKMFGIDPNEASVAAEQFGNLSRARLWPDGQLSIDNFRSIEDPKAFVTSMLQSRPDLMTTVKSVSLMQDDARGFENLTLTPEQFLRGRWQNRGAEFRADSGTEGRTASQAAQSRSSLRRGDSVDTSEWLSPAIRYEDEIYSTPPGTTHGTVIQEKLGRQLGFDPYDKTLPEHKQFWDQVAEGSGFLDSEGNFLTREEAFRYADKNFENQQLRQKGVGGSKDAVNELHTDGLVWAPKGRVLGAKDPPDLFADSGTEGRVASQAGQALRPEQASFYSAAERAIEGAKQTKATPQEWLNWLKNQPGVTKDELEYWNLDDWAKGDTRPTTKQDLLDHIQEYKLGLEEKEVRSISDRERDALNIRGSEIGREIERYYQDGIDPNEPEVRALLKEQDQIIKRLSVSPRYAQYTLPGGENYREIIATLPHKEDALLKARIEALRNERREMLQKEGDPSLEEEARFEQIESELRALHSEKDAATSYTHSHWPEVQNPLYHMRVKDREIPEAGFVVRNPRSENKSEVFSTEKEAEEYWQRLPESLRREVEIVEASKPLKAFHLEELQSDWHQQGRKQGYRDPNLNLQPLIDAADKARQVYTNATIGVWEHFSDGKAASRREAMDLDSARNVIVKADAFMSTDPEYLGLEKAADDAYAALSKARTQKDSGIPNAPFKKNWAELGLRNALLKAVQGGYDAVSWTPGIEQAKRYNLSKQVDHIDYREVPGGYQLGVVSTSGHPIDLPKETFTKDELADLVGKEVAEKIVNGEGQAGGGRKTLMNIDLQVGGEGMKAFYDKMLVNKANDLGKKYGAKVEWKDLAAHEKFDGGISGEDAMRAVGPEGRRRFGIPENTEQQSTWWRSTDQQSRDEVFELARERLSEEKTFKIPVLKITPELRQHVIEKGLPLFADSGGEGRVASQSAQARRAKEERKALEEAQREYATGEFSLRDIRELFGAQRTPKGTWELVRNKDGLTVIDQQHLVGWLEGYGVDELRKNPDFDVVLERLPKRPGTAYRGMMLPPKQAQNLLSKLKPGKTFTVDRHSSVSSNKGPALHFATEGDFWLPDGGALLFQIQQKSSREIPRSVYKLVENNGYEFGWQKEAILPKGTQLQVVSVRPVKDRLTSVPMHVVTFKEVKGRKNAPLLRLEGDGVSRSVSQSAASQRKRSEQDEVPWPEGTEPDDDASHTQNRAAGGRVVAENINHKPSEGQKEAGNYKKDKIHILGLLVTIENAKGQPRSGVGKDGKRWTVTMPAHYGYVNGSVGADKDHVDVYVGPHVKAPNVYVIDQRNAETGEFDEHKCCVGFASEVQAIRTYLKGFSDGKGPQRFGAMKRMTVGEFKKWVFSPKAKKPVAS